MTDRTIPTVGDLVYQGIRASDAVFADASSQITRIIRDMPELVSDIDRLQAMARIDQVMDASFGNTPGRARASDLYDVLVKARTNAVIAPFEQAASFVQGVLQNDVLYRGLYGPVVDAQRARQASLFDPERRWVREDGYRLSDRVWRGGRRMREEIDNTIRDAISKGQSAEQLARRLERYIDPSHAPTRWSRNGVHKRSIQRSPYAASSARRLARTEIMHAYGMATIEATRATPGSIGIKWATSRQHPAPDECDDNANRDGYNLGRGVYPFDAVPRYPNHSNCMCNLQPVMGSREDVLDAIVAEYGDQPVQQLREPVVFKPAKTIPEAQRYAKEQLGVGNANYRNVKEANFINSGLTDLRNNGVNVDYTHIVAAKQGRNGNIASFGSNEQRTLRPGLVEPARRQLIINTDNPYWRDPVSAQRDLRNTRFNSTGDPFHTIVHETAHKSHYEYLLQKHGNDSFWHSDRSRLPLDQAIGDKELARRISQEVSGYAEDNVLEAVAEIWTGTYFGVTYSDEIMALYQRLDGPPLIRRKAQP